MSTTTTSAPSRLRFSGHETFVCRLSWLRKGLMFVSEEDADFNADDAVITLGVGKNMVASIRFWLRAFGLTEETDSLTPFGTYLWEVEPQRDPFFEKQGSIWLLHYYLVTSGYASIFEYFFHDFAVGRFSFAEEQLYKALQRKCIELDLTVAENTLEKDVKMLLRTLVRPTSKKKADFEELFSGVLADLGLLRSANVEKFDGSTEEQFSIPRESRPDLPWQVVLHCILAQLPDGGLSVTFKDMMHQPKSPGVVFLLSRDGLFEKIEEITKAYPGKAIFSQTAGNEVLQLNGEWTEFTPLDEYYGC